MQNIKKALLKQKDLAEKHFYHVEAEIQDIQKQIEVLLTKLEDKRTQSDEAKYEVSEILRAMAKLTK